MSGLGFVRLPRRSLRVLRTFLDGFNRQKSPNLVNHPHVIDACRGRRVSGETQLYNELVLWLRYYEALMAGRPTHLDLMDRLRDEYEKLMTFVRADVGLSPYFGLNDVDVVSGMLYTDDYIPRLDVFMHGLYDLSAHLTAKDGRKVADSFGFINVRPDEVQRLVTNARSAADNMREYRLLDVRDFENRDPLILSFNRLMYLCRVVYAMSKGWKEIRDGTMDRINLLRRRLVLSMHENPAFARIYVRNALDAPVEHGNVYGIIRRIENDSDLFRNALRWGDPDWGLDSTTDEDEDDDDEGDDDDGKKYGAAASYRDRLFSESDAKSSVPESLKREQQRRKSESSWRSATESEFTDEAEGFPSVSDAPKPLIADPDAVSKKPDVKGPPTSRLKSPKGRSSAGPSSLKSKDERPVSGPASPIRPYWLESGKSTKGAQPSDKIFSSDGKSVNLPVPSSVGIAAVPLSPSLPSRASSVQPPPVPPLPAVYEKNPFGSGIKPAGSVGPPISYLDEKYFRASEPPSSGKSSGTRQQPDASTKPKTSGGGKVVKRTRRKSATDSRTPIATYRKPRAVRSEDEDGYYWDDLESPDVPTGRVSDEVFSPDEEFERIQRKLQGLNISSPSATPAPPQFVAPSLPSDLLAPTRPRNSLFVPDEEREANARGSSESSGVTDLSKGTDSDKRKKSKSVSN